MTLHERIAKALNWSVSEVYTFSLPTLREWVRTIDPKLAHEISQIVLQGSHWYQPK